MKDSFWTVKNVNFIDLDLCVYVVKVVKKTILIF